MQTVMINPGGTSKFVRDATANDSDKTFTVPTGKMWRLVLVAATLQCTATVGIRSFGMFIYDTTPNIVWRTVNVALTANQNGTYFLGFGSYNPAIATVGKEVNTNGVGINAGVQETFPEIILTAGMSIRVWDATAVDAAADDLTVTLNYVEYDV